MSREEAIQLTPGLGSPTILLVDDDPSILVLYSTALQREGCTILQASDSNGALQLCQQHSGEIQLFILDLLLLPPRLQLRTTAHRRPETSSLTLLRQVVALHPQIKVLLMSAYSDAELKEYGIVKPVGISFLRKPFRPETLVRTVREILVGTPHG